jgi:DNA gyrase/topoisomerase IV subunit B
MDYKTSNITLIEWFEAVRRRPDLYIGAEEADRSQRVGLLEYVVNDITRQRPQEVRILLWREDAITVRWQPPANQAVRSPG